MCNDVCVVTRFDLTETRGLPAARRTRWFHGLLRALLGVGIVAVGYWTAHDVITNGWTASNATVAGIEVVAGILFGWIFVMTGPGADFLEVDEDGIELGFGRGRIRRLKWNDAHLGLNLFQIQYPEEDGLTVQLIEFGSGVWPVTNYVTFPALNAVLRGAEEHGLRVVVRPSPQKRLVWYRISHRYPQ